MKCFHFFNSVFGFFFIYKWFHIGGGKIPHIFLLFSTRKGVGEVVKKWENIFFPPFKKSEMFLSFLKLAVLKLLGKKMSIQFFHRMVCFD